MYALYLFGPPLEATLGRVRFLSLYLLSALGGSAMSYAFNAPNQGSLGASGAVFGLLGRFFIVNRKLGRDNSGLLVLVAINFAFGFLRAQHRLARARRRPHHRRPDRRRPRLRAAQPAHPVQARRLRSSYC